MEKKKNKLIPVVIILIILILGLGGFVVYDKVLKENNDNSDVENNDSNNQEENTKQESVEDWLKDNILLIRNIENYKKDTATDKDYSKIVIYYLVHLYEKTYYEDDDLPFEMEKSFVLSISKNKVKKLLNEHFGVKNTIINLEQFNHNDIKFHEDTNNYYMDTIPLEGTSYNHNLSSIIFKDENKIEVTYELYSGYPDTNGTSEEDDDTFPYMGSKKVILSKNSLGYQILESTTEKVK